MPGPAAKTRLRAEAAGVTSELDAGDELAGARSAQAVNHVDESVAAGLPARRIERRCLVRIGGRRRRQGDAIEGVEELHTDFELHAIFLNRKRAADAQLLVGAADPAVIGV